MLTSVNFCDLNAILNKVFITMKKFKTMPLVSEKTESFEYYYRNGLLNYSLIV